MSTEYQQYSTENQQTVIREFARQHGMTIVRTYSDAVRSGLSISGREALKQLIVDVESGQPSFSAILVYDVSRWGRFQDADESAYYEYICRRANVAVHYCAEPFENDGSPPSSIIKGVKRVMASEFSRELSAKVFLGQCRLVERGFRQGGAPGIGLRRMLVEGNGRFKKILSRGEHKSIQTEHVILVPGPREEIDIVRQIFFDFVENRMSMSAIARSLNERGIPGSRNGRWCYAGVKWILLNEKYIGNNIYNRISGKLGTKHTRNPPEMWVRRNSAFEAIISWNVFAKAQKIYQERRKWSRG